METRRTSSRIGAADCGLTADIEDGTSSQCVRLDHALSRGYCCVKGRRVPDTVNHPDRLRNCLVRDPQGECE
jgi:anaerobic selenocysteine-containing dehydrogenase